MGVAMIGLNFAQSAGASDSFSLELQGGFAIATKRDGPFTTIWFHFGFADTGCFVSLKRKIRTVEHKSQGKAPKSAILWNLKSGRKMAAIVLWRGYCFRVSP